jgi:hypothetical protein
VEVEPEQLLLVFKSASVVFRTVHLRRKVGFWAVYTIPTVFTPYSTVSQIYGVRPYKTGPPYNTFFTVTWPLGSNVYDTI